MLEVAGVHWTSRVPFRSIALIFWGCGSGFPGTSNSIVISSVAVKASLPSAGAARNCAQ